ncbi:unnamed protein product [Musa banksii]
MAPSSVDSPCLTGAFAGGISPLSRGKKVKEVVGEQPELHLSCWK